MKVADYSAKLLQGRSLTYNEAHRLFNYIIDGSVSDVQMASFLTLFKLKGETTNEIHGFVQGMRDHMIKISHRGVVVDTCGTGGDGSNSFNISTTVAFVVAGAGVAVAKHGNKAASSKCGSADVLESLGVNIMLMPNEAEAVLNKVGMVFLFAPLYHAALKPLVLVRKELGFPTIFNFLGPFCNPAGVKRQIIGVPNKDIASKLAKMATELDYDYLMIVTNEDGLDEVGLESNTHAWIVEGKKISKITIDPKKNGFKTFGAGSIKGGDAKENADIVRGILEGETGMRRDIVILNAACVLRVAGRVKSIGEGIELACRSIDSGAAINVLENLITETQKYA